MEAVVFATTPLFTKRAELREGWMHGQTKMPDRKLLMPADVLDSRAMSGKASR